jgi:hypothetical protein
VLNCEAKEQHSPFAWTGAPAATQKAQAQSLFCAELLDFSAIEVELAGAVNRIIEV